MAKPCPCTSGLWYADCCAPLHRGAREAGSPEALMRSRFSAFALREVDYLWRTLHAEHPDRASPREQVLAALREAARTHRYMRLAILEARGPRVLFLARVFHRGADRSFVELSTFERDEAGWRYLSGEARPAASGRVAEKVAQELTIDAFLAG